MVHDSLSQIRPEMKKAVSRLLEQMKSIRTGRANSGLVEDLLVTYYGTKTPLKQLATIQVPESTTLLIQPWDPKSLGDIEQAIRESELGLSPTNDGRVIRLSMPPLTSERRAEMVKMLHKMGEETRVALRTIRKEVWDSVQAKAKKGEVTEDERYQIEEELNNMIDEFNKEVEEHIREKEEEVLKV